MVNSNIDLSYADLPYIAPGKPAETVSVFVDVFRLISKQYPRKRLVVLAKRRGLHHPKRALSVVEIQDGEGYISTLTRPLFLEICYNVGLWHYTQPREQKEVTTMDYLVDAICHSWDIWGAEPEERRPGKEICEKSPREKTRFQSLHDKFMIEFLISLGYMVVIYSLLKEKEMGVELVT